MICWVVSGSSWERLNFHEVGVKIWLSKIAYTIPPFTPGLISYLLLSILKMLRRGRINVFPLKACVLQKNSCSMISARTIQHLMCETGHQFFLITNKTRSSYTIFKILTEGSLACLITIYMLTVWGWSAPAVVMCRQTMTWVFTVDLRQIVLARVTTSGGWNPNEAY